MNNSHPLPRTRNGLLACVRTAQITLTLLFSLQAHANDPQCYTLVPRDRGQYAMCLELERNLNEFCGERPLVCGLKVSPKHPKLTLPNWTNLPLEPNLGLVERLVRGSQLHGEAGSPGSTIRAWDLLHDRLAQNMKDGKATLSRSTIDLTNSGVPEVIFRIDTGFCPDLNFGVAANEPEWKHIIEKRKSTERYIKTDPTIFPERAAQILDNSELRARAEAGEEPFRGASAMTGVTDIFFYEGRAFKFNWELRPWVQEITTARDNWPETPNLTYQTVACEFTYTGFEE